MFDIFHGILFPETFHRWTIDRERSPENLERFRRNQEEVLIGIRGQQFMETGYVYAPYVPLLVTPTIISPDEEPSLTSLSRNILSRYSQLNVRPEYYGVINAV